MEYPGSEPQERREDESLHDSNPVVKDVWSSFSKIRLRGDYLAANDQNVFPKHRYTYKNYSNNRSKIHFQGIQRHRDGRYLIISGGDSKHPTSHVFVIKLNSRECTDSEGKIDLERTQGPWGSNIVLADRAPAGDVLIKIIALNDNLWHAGGIHLLGDILAIPIEEHDHNSSRIVFLDMKDPENPLIFGNQTAITRDSNTGKAGATALCKLAHNGHYLCAIWSDSDPYPKRLDFYLSKSANFVDGFQQNPVSWPFSELIPTGGRDSRYQAINFVQQDDGKLYLIGTENTSPGAPIIKGDDFADLFLVEFPEQIKDDPPKLEKPTIQRVSEKKFYWEEEYSNLAAGGGTYIDPSGQLYLYSAFHWRRNHEFHFTEFRPEISKSSPKITNIEDAWIDLFEHEGFRGRRLSVIGLKDEKISDYKKIHVQHKGFGDKMSSVRFQIPVGFTYRLFKDSNFKLGKGKNTHLDLEGNGFVKEINDLGQEFDFDEEVSSSRYV